MHLLFSTCIHFSTFVFNWINNDFLPRKSQRDKIVLLTIPSDFCSLFLVTVGEVHWKCHPWQDPSSPPFCWQCLLQALSLEHSSNSILVKVSWLHSQIFWTKNSISNVHHEHSDTEVIKGSYICGFCDIFHSSARWPGMILCKIPLRCHNFSSIQIQALSNWSECLSSWNKKKSDLRVIVDVRMTSLMVYVCCHYYLERNLNIF